MGVSAQLTPSSATQRSTVISWAGCDGQHIIITPEPLLFDSEASDIRGERIGLAY